MTIIKPLLAPPSRRAALGEVRVVKDVAQMLVRQGHRWLRRQSSSSTVPVIVLPGFGAGDASTWPLRRFLRDQGFAAEGWGLGVNLAGENLRDPIDWPLPPGFVDRGELSVPRLIAKARQQVVMRSEALGQKIALVGWSLGGYVAREVAREVPAAVSHVITLGSPVHGGPKYTAAAPLFKRRGVNLDWVETEIRKRDVDPITVPITAIVSPTDGVVGYAAASDSSPNTRQIDIDASHMGMGFRQDVWALVVQALADNAATI